MKTNDLIFDRSFVNGKWTIQGDLTFEVTNPANGDRIQTLSDGGVQITEMAINAADRAFRSWRKTTAKYRGDILEKWNDLILKHTKELAEIMTLECGKPFSESKGEVAYGASFIKWFAEEGKRTYGDVIPPHTKDRRLVVIKQPVGVVAAITPWNFPLAMITRKVAPALAAGCTVVIRPTDESPLTALAIVHLSEIAGFPPGVINVIVGKDSAAMGKLLCESQKVKKISFTGSTRIGHILMAQSASTLKKLSLELGGNAPFIVFEDADIDKAVKGAIVSKFRNAGQTCVCVNRILVHEKVYDEFSVKLTNEVAALKVGDGMLADVSIGPMINIGAVEKTKEFVSDAISKGGKILTGGNPINQCFFEPTVIGNATRDMSFFKDEIFGPLAPLYKFTSDEEAIEIANDTIYGLASYFYSENVSRCWRVAEAL